MLTKILGSAAGLLALATLAAAAMVPPAGKPLEVLTTTGMIADAARRIGGERVHVTALMGPGVDPHLYKATPGDMRSMQNADLILYNGLQLEGRLADVLVRLAARKTTVQVTDSIPEDRLREPPEFEGHYDPHVWFDVEIWIKAVERTRDALIASDGAGKDEYKAAAEKYTRELRELHEFCKSEISRVPQDRRVLVTAHDAFGYFGRAYGIEVLAVQGISTDSESGLKQINALVDTLVARKVPAVFIESSVSRKNIDALVEGCKARGHIIRVGGELFSDAMGKAETPEGTYVGMVRHNIKTIVDALVPSEAPAAKEPVKPSPASTAKP